MYRLLFLTQAQYEVVEEERLIKVYRMWTHYE